MGEKHTPAPWAIARATKYAGAGINIVGPNGSYVCLVGQFGDETAMADAKIIAASVNMKKALEQIAALTGGQLPDFARAAHDIALCALDATGAA